VNQPRHPFRINVGFLFNQPIGYRREFPFEYPLVELSPEFIFSNFQGTAAFDRTQQGLRLEGDFSATFPLTCSRCLESFESTLHTHFEEIFTYPDYPLSENEQVIPENGFIDLQEYISDYLALEIPINPICQPDCRGLCSQCGQNLNLGVCEHQQPVQDNSLSSIHQS